MGKSSAIELFRRPEQLNQIGVALARARHRTPARKHPRSRQGPDRRRCRNPLQHDARWRALRFEIMRTDSLGIRQGGTTGSAWVYADLPLRRADGSPNDALVAAHAAIHERSQPIADVYAGRVFDFSGTHAFDQRTGYRSQSFSTVPMKNHEGAVTGVLQLINAI